MSRDSPSVSSYKHSSKRESSKHERRERDSFSSDRKYSSPKKRKSNRSRSRSSSPPSKKELKATAKIHETPEEKRARRLAKKLAKQEKLNRRFGSEEKDDNPFGDPEIHQTFVWKSKLKKEGLEHLSVEEVKKINRRKQEEAREELEKVRQRRLLYEKERADREEEQQLVQREKEAAQFRLWEEQEDVFHLKQAQIRSAIRIRDGRAKPIDRLAQYINQEGGDLGDLGEDVREPYLYVEGLEKEDLEDLLEDIFVYKKLENEKNEENLQFWEDVSVIVQEELRKIRRNEAGREGVSLSVSTDVTSVFKGKTLTQLSFLEKQIKEKISGRTEGVDVSYWESLSQQVGAYIARVRLREKHQETLQKKLAELKKQQGIQDEDRLLMPPPHSPLVSLPPQPPTDPPSDSATSSNPSTSSKNEASSSVFYTEEEEESIAEYNVGQYSPALIPLGGVDLVDLVDLVEPDEDLKKLLLARSQVEKTGSAEILSTEDSFFEKEAKKNMTNDEAQFSVEAFFEKTPTYFWSEKYRPRKPRYFNRVHTGFEWNKYNQTHYDMENPPPKVVQGYKFNIFYPDLIDKNVTPKYTIVQCRDNRDFSVLRITAGPPYEDIAFKVVNREWEYSYKRGFRCHFNNNIFQLWFHFKRYRYRR